jgi:hypothetical protein
VIEAPLRTRARWQQRTEFERAHTLCNECTCLQAISLEDSMSIAGLKAASRTVLAEDSSAALRRAAAQQQRDSEAALQDAAEKVTRLLLVL